MKIAGLAALVTYVLRQQYGCSWLFAAPVYFALFLAYYGYRILSARFLNPVSRLPGPRVVPVDPADLGALAMGRIQDDYA
jgi:hypothetical protein